MQKICAHVASQASCQASVSRGRGARQVSLFKLFTYLQKADFLAPELCKVRTCILFRN